MDGVDALHAPSMRADVQPMRCSVDSVTSTVPGVSALCTMPLWWQRVSARARFQPSQVNSGVPGSAPAASSTARSVGAGSPLLSVSRRSASHGVGPSRSLRTTAGAYIPSMRRSARRSTSSNSCATGESKEYDTRSSTRCPSSSSPM
ncbi:hypothetical protein HEP87_61620 [Streptomyces sp. S1D4-11]